MNRRKGEEIFQKKHEWSVINKIILYSFPKACIATANFSFELDFKLNTIRCDYFLLQFLCPTQFPTYY